MKTQELSNPEAAKQLYAMAYRYYEGRHYKEAVQFFRVLCSIDCDTQKHWLGLGASLQMMHDYTEALSAYGMAAILDRKTPEAHLYAAECFIALKRIPDAKNALTMASESLLKSKDSELRSLLAILQAECNNQGQREVV